MLEEERGRNGSERDQVVEMLEERGRDIGENKE